MTRLERNRLARTFVLAIPLAALVGSISGCAGKKLEPAPPPENAGPETSGSGALAGAPRGSEDVAELEAALKASAEDRARLRETLAERSAELSAVEEAKASLELELQSALEELMRSQASIRNVQSRAFAVSRIAEVRVEVDSFRSMKDPALTDRLDRADDFLSRADRALKDDNVGGAAYLAARASELLRQVRTVAEIRAREPKELIPIVPPREIEVSASAVLRKVPSADGERVRSVDPGTRLLAVARQGDWYQVEVDGGGLVWIHRRRVR